MINTEFNAFRGITAENMEKSQHTDLNEDTTNVHSYLGRPSVECVSVEHRVNTAPVSRAPQLIITNYLG